MTGTIVSFTSIPSRIERIGPVIESLRRQTAKIDAIILWIPQTYRRPEFRGYTLPNPPAGVEVRYCDLDYGPATKILPAAKAFGNQDVRIIYCDDDEIYDPDWAEALISASERYPDDCIAINGLNVASVDHEVFSRSWRFRFLNITTLNLYRQFYRRRAPWRRPGIGPVDICQGFGGVLVRPRFLGPEAYSIPDVLWTVDDIWLSGHMVTRGVTIRRVSERKKCRRSDLSRIDDLTSYSHNSIGRIKADHLCVEYYRERYGIWRQPKMWTGTPGLPGLRRLPV